MNTNPFDQRINFYAGSFRALVVYWFRVLSYGGNPFEFDNYADDVLNHISLLEYLLVIPALLKLPFTFDRYYSVSRFLGFLIVFWVGITWLITTLFSIITYPIAAILTVISLPFIFIISKVYAYKCKVLYHSMMNIKVLPIRPEQMLDMGFRISHEVINENKLIEIIQSNPNQILNYENYCKTVNSALRYSVTPILIDNGSDWKLILGFYSGNNAIPIALLLPSKEDKYSAISFLKLGESIKGYAKYVLQADFKRTSFASRYNSLPEGSKRHISSNGLVITEQMYSATPNGLVITEQMFYEDIPVKDICKQIRRAETLGQIAISEFNKSAAHGTGLDYLEDSIMSLLPDINAMAGIAPLQPNQVTQLRQFRNKYKKTFFAQAEAEAEEDEDDAIELEKDTQSSPTL